MAQIENLKPVRSTEEARERGSRGGKASAAARKEAKVLSQAYGEYLAARHDVTLDGEAKQMTGADLIGAVVTKVLSRCDSASVAMLREIREATEKRDVVIDAYLKQQNINIVMVDDQTIAQRMTDFKNMTDAELIALLETGSATRSTIE